MIEIDLNLLRVFDTLIEVRSVTRAAGKLGLTQSAVSHALARLRNALDDPLFVRAPGGLQPTARALEIAPGVREGLAQLRGALSPTEFDPATASRTFTLAAGSYFCVLLVPELIARVRAAAPDVVLRAARIGFPPGTRLTLFKSQSGFVLIARIRQARAIASSGAAARLAKPQPLG